MFDIAITIVLVIGIVMTLVPTVMIYIGWTRMVWGSRDFGLALIWIFLHGMSLVGLGVFLRYLYG